jgi:23S rRNA (cytosine1962-C5)-methyltransferase
MKPDALKQILMELVALSIWQQSSARQLLLQLGYLPDATTEMLLGDVAAEWHIRESGLRYTFDLWRRQGHGMPARRHVLRAGNEEGIDFSFTC